VLLGIDTTTKVCSVALLDENRIIGEFTLLHDSTHSQKLLPLIDRLFDEAGVKKEKLEGVAVARGPGSFTGVRIGLATAIGLGLSLGCPVIGVVTLDALAEAVACAEGLIVPMMDARRHQVYSAVYRGGRKLDRVTSYMAVGVDALVEKINSIDKKAMVYCLGDGLLPYRNMLQQALPGRFNPIPAGLNINRSALVAQVGRQLLNRGDICVEPLYLRLSDAERHKLSQEGEGEVGR